MVILIVLDAEVKKNHSFRLHLLACSRWYLFSVLFSLGGIFWREKWNFRVAKRAWFIWLEVNGFLVSWPNKRSDGSMRWQSVTKWPFLVLLGSLRYFRGPKKSLVSPCSFWSSVVFVPRTLVLIRWLPNGVGTFVLMDTSFSVFLFFLFLQKLSSPLCRP